MIELTLTDFLNIVQSTGMTKSSKIKRIKTRIYSPATDYYKSLREKIIEVISNGDDVTNILPNNYHVHEDKKQNYEHIANNFIHWLSTKKNWTWVNPPRVNYGTDVIQVKVNPEIAFIDKANNTHVIKLHFNKDTLSKGKLDVAGCLFSSSLTSKVPVNTKFYFLDLHQRRLFTVKNHANVEKFLYAELNYINTIWHTA